MKFIQEYVAYLKDNPNRYWFKRKGFGWGWTPATWEGWLVMLVFLAAIILNALRLDEGMRADGGFVNEFLIETVLMVAVLLFICYKKGEKPRWEWGFPKRDILGQQEKGK